MYIFSESTLKVSTESTDPQALIGHAIFRCNFTDLCDMDKQKGTLPTLNGQHYYYGNIKAQTDNWDKVIRFQYISPSFLDINSDMI